MKDILLLLAWFYDIPLLKTIQPIIQQTTLWLLNPEKKVS
jgi:hypothetical protein